MSPTDAPPALRSDDVARLRADLALLCPLGDAIGAPGAAAPTDLAVPEAGGAAALRWDRRRDWP